MLASIGVIAFAAPTFTGCGEKKVLVSTEDYPTSVFSLVQIDDCDTGSDEALRQSLIATMNEQLDQQIENSLDNNSDYYCLDGGGPRYYAVGDVAFAEGSASNSATNESADDAVLAPVVPGAQQVKTAGESSDTNNQVDGVDEADLVKHDGKHIYVIDGEGFKVIDAFHGNDVADIDNAKIIADVKIDGQPKKLLLKDNRLAVFIAVDRDNQNDQGWYYQPRECTYGYHCDFSGDGKDTLVQIYDVENKDEPKLIRELKNNGALLASRQIGDAVFVALSHPKPVVEELAFWIDESVL